MHPAPIKIEAKDLPPAIYVNTLASGERIYRDSNGNVYAVQPKRNDNKED